MSCTGPPAVSTSIRIRPSRASDAEEIAVLFYQTIHEVNARDYTPAQLAVWAPSIYPASFWRRRLHRYSGFVAEVNGRLAGFALLDGTTGYVESLFVAADRQRCGVGRRLIRRVVREARRRGCSKLESDVSVTAEPFFRKMGFRRVRRVKKLLRNQVFRQYKMVRSL